MEAEVIWETRDGLHRYVIRPGETVYIGRPDNSFLEKYPDLNPLETYIIPLDQSKKPVPTGIHLLTISRLDTKIKITETGDTVQITNHGPRGTGAKNPTLIDGQYIPPGSTIEKPLTKSIRIDLTSIGPTFIITPREILTITPEEPIRLPSTIAQELINKGLVKESAKIDEGTTAVVVTGIIGKEILTKLENMNIVIEEIKNHIMEKERTKQQLLLIKEKLLTIYMEIDTEPKKALTAINELKLTPYKNQITKIGSHAKTLYNEIIILSQQPPIPTTIQQIKQKIQELIQQIKANEEA